MTFGSRCSAALAAAAIVLFTLPSFAETRPEVEAKERFGRGIDLYAQGDYGGALAEFKRAYDLAPYAVILYNLGLTYAALGRPVEATDTLQRVIDKPGSLSPERLAKAKATLNEQSARIAELVVEANVEGARIEIDGAEVATTPAKPIRVKGGPHRVGLVLSGYAPSRKEIDVAAGGHEKIRFDLAPTDKRLAHIDVRANVPGATVLVDGAAIGASPLASTVSVLPGPHEVQAKRLGYRPATRQIEVGEGSTGEVRLELEEDPAEVRDQGGDLRLSISENSPVIIVDGKLEPGVAPSIRLSPGPHRIRVERAGFFAVERDVDVPARGNLAVQVDLEPTAETRASYVRKNTALRTWGLAGIVGGAVVAGGGATIAGVYIAQRSSIRQTILDLPSKSIDGTPCGQPGGTQNKVQACAALLKNDQASFSRAETLMIVGWATAGVGVAGIATGIVLRAASDDPHRYDRKHDETFGARLSPTFAVAPGLVSLGVQGAF
jgi:PEGA domain/Tetratricopeptide repeat